MRKEPPVVEAEVRKVSARIGKGDAGALRAPWAEQLPPCPYCAQRTRWRQKEDQVDVEVAEVEEGAAVAAVGVVDVVGVVEVRCAGCFMRPDIL